MARYAPGNQRKIRVKGAHWAIKESDAPAGFYLVTVDHAGQMRGEARRLKSTISPFLTPQQTTRTASDHEPVPTAASRYASNPPSAPIALSARELVVPTPLSTDSRPGQVRIDSSTVVAYAPGLEATASLLAKYLHEDFGVDVRKVEGLEPGRNVIRLQTVSVDGARELDSREREAYTLEIDELHGIDVIGQGAAGVFYGVQTLRALVPIDAYRSRPGAVQLACVDIHDEPRFAYRGLHLDVARNFQSVKTVKKLLDLMAFYKLNRLHWHLTDDEGWRFQIKALPELTEVGARRGHTVDESDCLLPSFGSGPDADAARSPGCGYYTQNEFIDVLRYAQARHIEIIPELDFPGHARAAIKSMQAQSARLQQAGDAQGAEDCLLTDPLDRSQYESVQLWRDNVVDVGLDSTYRVLEAVLDEIVEMYRVAAVPLSTVHLGGDEVPQGAWHQSPACQRLLRAGAVKDLGRKTLHEYFFGRLVASLTRRQVRAACWEECVLAEQRRDGRTVKRPLHEYLSQNVVAYLWNNVWGWGQEDVAYQLANAGYDVVLCNATNLYFDLAYDKDPREPGYYWAGFVDERKPFEFMPLDLYKNAHADAFGNRIPPEAYANRPRLTAAGKRRIVGLQGQLWSENLSTRKRLEHAAFPKMISLAERAWTAEPAWATLSDVAIRQGEIEKDWQRFANRLGQRELPRLDFLCGGVNYRIPPPGARVVDGQVQANVSYPGFEIRYTVDGVPPTKVSTLYEAPISPDGVIKFKAFSSTGRPSATTLIRP